MERRGRKGKRRERGEKRKAKICEKRSEAEATEERRRDEENGEKEERRDSSGRAETSRAEPSGGAGRGLLFLPRPPPVPSRQRTRTRRGVTRLRWCVHARTPRLVHNETHLNSPYPLCSSVRTTRLRTVYTTVRQGRGSPPHRETPRRGPPRVIGTDRRTPSGFWLTFRVISDVERLPASAEDERHGPSRGKTACEPVDRRGSSPNADLSIEDRGDRARAQSGRSTREISCSAASWVQDRHAPTGNDVQCPRELA